MSEEEKSEWHLKGNKASIISRNKNPVKLKIKNKEKYCKNRSIGAMKRKRYICDLCGKDNLDASNLIRHKNS